MIEVKNVSWRYSDDGVDVLRGIDLTVEQGEFLGIMGPTGAGKTSLAQVIRGIIPGFHDEGHFAGQVVVNNVDVSQSDPQHTANDIGLVFQDAGSQIIGTRVIQDATLGPSNLGMDRRTVVERATKYLSKVKLGGLEERASSALSGGQMQRLAIAGVLAVEPTVLVLDEPVAELDPVGRRQVANILAELRDVDGATVILIEQDPELVAQFCSRVVLLSEGQIVREGTPREVFSDPSACLEYGVFAPEAAVLSQLANGGRPVAPVPFTAVELMDRMEFVDDAITIALNNPPQKQTLLSAPSGAAIEVAALTFSYDNVQNVLDNVSLTVHSGEYLAIVGSNGAGKTTLTKHLNGLRRPASGTVKINGRDIDGVSTSQVALEIGYCFQNPDHQIFSKTALEEVMFGLECQGVDRDEAETRATRILEQFGMARVADQNPHSLGKGERQKIALASILVLEPPIVVIDEPTTGLDWAEAREILDLIDAINAAGATVLAVTHDMRLVRDRARRVIAMSNAKIVFDGDVVEFFLDTESMREADVEPPPVSEVLGLLVARTGLPASALPSRVEDLAKFLRPLARTEEGSNE
jgi:energy-coupling factor transporter ATP-binding protein EcfA2